MNINTFSHCKTEQTLCICIELVGYVVTHYESPQHPHSPIRFGKNVLYNKLTVEIGR